MGNNPTEPGHGQTIADDCFGQTDWLNVHMGHKTRAQTNIDLQATHRTYPELGHWFQVYPWEGYRGDLGERRHVIVPGTIFAGKTIAQGNERPNC